MSFFKNIFIVSKGVNLLIYKNIFFTPKKDKKYSKTLSHSEYHWVDGATELKRVIISELPNSSKYSPSPLLGIKR